MDYTEITRKGGGNMDKPDVSICVPVFNEEENIRPMYAAMLLYERTLR